MQLVYIFVNTANPPYYLVTLQILSPLCYTLWQRPPSARQRPQRPTPEPRRPAARRAEGAQRPWCVSLRAGQKARLERLHDLDLLDAPLQPEAKHRAAVSLHAAHGVVVVVVVVGGVVCVGGGVRVAIAALDAVD